MHSVQPYPLSTVLWLLLLCNVPTACKMHEFIVVVVVGERFMLLFYIWQRVGERPRLLGQELIHDTADHRHNRRRINSE